MTFQLAGISICNTGNTLASGAASTSTTIPTVSGQVPNWVRITATAPAYVKLGVAGVTAVAGDMMVQPGDALIVRSQSLTNWACIQVSAAGIVQVSPIDQL